MSRRSLAEILARLESRVDGRSTDQMNPEPVLCVLPRGHSCIGGWHVRADGGQGTAYQRCPRSSAARAAANAALVPGEQTFESFEAMREPAAFQAAKLWVEACGDADDPGAAKLALLRPDHLDANTGCGKTHLLRAAARELARRGRWVELVRAAELSAVVRGRALFDSWERSTAEISVKRWSACDDLILDDLGQEEAAGPVTGAFLTGLLNDREGRSLAWASNLSERELAGRYGAALLSRLVGGAHTPSLRGRDFRRAPVRQLEQMT